MAFDHELKLRRAFSHLNELDAVIKGWLDGDNYTIRQEYHLETADSPLAILATVAEQPPVEPMSLLIGDALHNMRSCLDVLAFSLAAAFTKPLPQDVGESSEFPIFGDEDRAGTLGVGRDKFHQLKRNGTPAPGSGLFKTQGWDPRAQAIVQGLQPYRRGNSYRSDSLWVLHDLDRINKHRLLHVTVAAFSGVILDVFGSVNLARFDSGTLHSLKGFIGTDTPIARIMSPIPIDPSTEVYVKIEPAIDIAFAKGTPSVEGQSVLKTLWELYTYIDGAVLPLLTPFL